MDQQLKFNILTNVIGSEKVDRFMNGVESMGGKFLKAAGTLYVFDMARRAAEFGLGKAQALIDYGDQLEALSEKTGIGSQALSGYKAAADQANLSFEGLEKGLKKFSQQLGDPNSKKFQDTLAAIGITSRDSAVVMDQLADKFANMENGPKKAALAVSLFGKAGIDMIPFLNQGSEALSKFGVKFSTDFTKNADEFNDALAISKNLLTEQAIAISEKYIPVLTDLAKAWNDVQISNRGATDLDGSSAAIKEFAQSAYTAFKFLAEGLDGIFTNILIVWTQASTIAKEAANILTLGKSSGSDFGDIGANFGKAWEAGDKDIKDSITEYQKRADERQADVFKFEQALFKTTEDRKNRTTDKKRTGGDTTLPSDELEKEADSIKKFRAEQEGQIALEKIKAQAFQLSTFEIERKTIAQQINNKATSESIKWSDESKAKLALVTEEIIKQRIAIIDNQEAEKQKFGPGAQAAFKTYLESVRDVSKQTEQMFTKAFANIEDVFVSFIRNGKADFKAFADAVIDDLVRISLRQATMGIYGSIGSLFNPSTNAVGDGAAAGVNLGNPGTSVTPFSVSGKLGATSQSAGGGINIQVTVNADGQTKTSGSQLGANMAAAISAAVKSQLVVEKRPGGLLAN